MNKEKGFSLIEMVVVLIVSSILAAGIVTYIGDSVDGFATASNSNKLASSGRTTIDRMTLELHNAVPNSIRVRPAIAQSGGGQCLEYVPFLAASTYIDPPFAGGGGDVFETVNFNPMLRFESPANVYAVIYPINTSDLYDELSTPGPIALVDKIRDTYDEDLVPDVCTNDPIVAAPENLGRSTICLDSTHRFSRRSPVQRIYIAEQPVSFCVVGDRIYRYQDYDFAAEQCGPDAAGWPGCLPQTAIDGRHLVTDRVANAGLQAFTVTPPTLRRNAVISFNFSFSDQGDSIVLNHEVVLRNVP